MRRLEQINIRQNRGNPATQSYRALTGSQLHASRISGTISRFTILLSAFTGYRCPHFAFSGIFICRKGKSQLTLIQEIENEYEQNDKAKQKKDDKTSYHKGVSRNDGGTFRVAGRRRARFVVYVLFKPLSRALRKRTG